MNQLIATLSRSAVGTAFLVVGATTLFFWYRTRKNPQRSLQNSANNNSNPETDLLTKAPIEAVENLSSTPIVADVEKKYHRHFKLLKKQQISHNVQLFTFELPEGESLDLPIGRHLKISTTVDGKQISRSYTPISLATTKGYFELLIKVYEAGQMSRYMHSLKESDLVQVLCPVGTFNYIPNQWKDVGMLAGGSGITPMLQVMRAIIANPEDKTRVTLLYSNSTEEDILLKEQLDNLVETHPHQIKIVHTVSQKAFPNWKGQTGRITKEMIQSTLPSPSEGTKILICGPLSFNKAMLEHLEGLGYTKEMIYKF